VFLVAYKTPGPRSHRGNDFLQIHQNYS
jgi:hypothetical protein